MSEEKSRPDGSPRDGFTVVDKRRFTVDGATSSEDTNTQEQSAAPQSQPQASEQKQKAVSPTESSVEKIDFISFVVSLGTQALVMLGEMPNPETRMQAINLEAAKQTIDILVMLEEKTKGNLSVEEAKLLSEILTTLRMAFVKKVNK